MSIFKKYGTRRSFVNVETLLSELTIARAQALILELEEATTIAFAQHMVKPQPKRDFTDYHLMNKEVRRKIAADYLDSPEAVQLCNVFRVSKQTRIFKVINDKILDRINVTRAKHELPPIEKLEDNAKEADGYLPFTHMDFEEAVRMFQKDIDASGSFIEYGTSYVLPYSDGSMKLITRQDYFNAISEGNRRASLSRTTEAR